MSNIDASKYAVGTVINPDGTTAKKDASKAGSMDNDAFMKLLVAQMKYQSPDSPVDTTAFMQQTAQLSQLETLQALSKGQTALLTAEQSTMATGMIGQKITATNSNGGAPITGVVTGIKLGSDGPILKLGDMEVPLSSVTEVNKAS